jgi:HlyD family secretion protein
MTKLSCQSASICCTLALIFLCGLSTGCKKKQEDAPEASVTVRAAHPTVAPISEEIVADAILAPFSEAALSSRINAPVRAEYVQRGDHVRRGQLLLTLDDRDLQGSALDFQGAYTSAQANYKATTDAIIPEELTKTRLEATQLKTALEVAQTTADERQRLYHQGALSGRDADIAVAAEAQAKAAYETARDHAEAIAQTTSVTDKQAAQGQLTSAKGRLENAEAQVSYANLRSPIDGVVTERPLFTGETAGAGTPVITIMNTTSLLAKLHLAQATAQELKLGHDAEIHIPGVVDPIKATVSFISPALDPGSTTVEVWLKLPNEDGHLKVGTPVHAVILGRTVSDALQVPASAILPGQDSGTVVMVIGSDGEAHKRAIKAGIRMKDTVQILTGLSTADDVISEGGYGLDEGTKVQIAKSGSGDGDNSSDRADDGSKDKN